MYEQMMKAWRPLKTQTHIFKPNTASAVTTTANYCYFFFGPYLVFQKAIRQELIRLKCMRIR